MKQLLKRLIMACSVIFICLLMYSCNDKQNEDGDYDSPQSDGDEDTVLTGLTYPIVDTSQDNCFDNSNVVQCPTSGNFAGQDVQYKGNIASYQDNGDGTVSDMVTGLMWQKSPELYDLSTFEDALNNADSFNLAGYDDWRLPTIKELYSLMDFRGSSQTLIPYIDTEYFDFRFGDESLGERVIDAQYWSATEYVGKTKLSAGANDAETVFGVNFADGRIKGYPKYSPDPQQGDTEKFVRYVRGNSSYGLNNFIDNEDETITDKATSLVWMKRDSQQTLNWQQALAYCENLDLADKQDWRLPNVKELQSIVDYTRAPYAEDTNRQGAAIDPIFDITEEESWFWSSTTLLEAGGNAETASQAAYVTFGRATGYGVDAGDVILDVHGAGAQRSDPKSGDPSDWEGGFGPQMDEIRIYNYARCVRGGDVEFIENPETGELNQTNTTESCSSDSDCENADACPSNSELGCACLQTLDGQKCVPLCNTDEDCPVPPDVTLVCAEDGKCVPE